MTTQDAIRLLAVAAAFDNRKPDPDAALAWSVALDGFRFEDVRDAIVAHYRETSDWLMPTHVIGRVRRVRAKRIDEHPPVIPPPDLGDTQELAWTREIRRRIGDGEQIDPDAFRGELTHRPEIRALVQSVTKATHPRATTPETSEEQG